MAATCQFCIERRRQLAGRRADDVYQVGNSARDQMGHEMYFDSTGRVALCAAGLRPAAEECLAAIDCDGERHYCHKPIGHNDEHDCVGPSDAEAAAGPRYPEITVELSGYDGNVFSLAARVTAALKRAGHRDQVPAFMAELTSAASYDAALRVMMAWVQVS